MKKPILLLLPLMILALLVGCKPVSQTAMLTLEPVTESVTNDENGIVDTKIYMSVSGGAEDRVLLESVSADGAPVFTYLDPALYAGTNVIAAFESYYAGGGVQVAVRRTDAGVTIDKRDTDEGGMDDAGNPVGGGCAEWEQIAQYAVPADAIVTWNNVGAPSATMVIQCANW